MDVTPKPTILQVALGVRKVIDRSDRIRIDLDQLLVLITQDKFFKSIESASEFFDIPKLNASDDIKDKNKVVILLPHRPTINSNFLHLLSQEKQDEIEKYIYKNILKKWHLNFNFYTFIEWYFLYRQKPSEDFILEPNPRMYFLYKKYPLEFLRNSHTTSDINFMLNQVRVNCGFFTPKDSDGLLSDIKFIMSINKNKNRGSRDLKKKFDDSLGLTKLGSIYRGSTNGTKTTIRFIAMDKLDEMKPNEYASDDEVKAERERMKKQFQRLKSKYRSVLKK
jgi:hypothetical protein